MCHNDSPAYFPEPQPHKEGQFNNLKFWSYEPTAAANSKTVLIITDIYGCNDFYQGFSAYWASQGWHVLMLDMFADLGELSEITREAAFARRHKLQDNQICNQIEALIGELNVNAVIGFCLGGNFVFELARRQVDVRLVGYYPFPAGLDNQDPIAPAFEYLESLTQPVTILSGAKDESAGVDNMTQMQALAEVIEALDVQLYEHSGHGFLANLESDDPTLKAEAVSSLKYCETVIGA